MRVYTYVIMFDAGSAPNYDPPMTTLAICKPRIRIAASVGNVVLAFTGSRLGPEAHGVRWAGIVSEKLTFADYWADKRFQGKKPSESARSDNIYRPVGAELVQVKNDSHDDDNVATDLGGQYVLLFKESWQFGAASPLMPEEFGLRMTGGRRSHRIHDIDNSQWSRLKKWLDSQKSDTKIETDEKPGCRPKPSTRCG